MERFVQDINTPAAPPQHKPRFLTVREALIEHMTYSVVDIEQFKLQYGRRTVITFKSLLTGAEHTVYAPKCLTKHFLTSRGEMDLRKAQMFRKLMITYKGYTEEPKWTNYNFKFVY